MTDLLSRFRAHLRTLPLAPGRALVAVSGGPDSMALLELLCRSADVHGHELVVAHVDHGVHPESASVARRVRTHAARRGLACESVELHLGSAAGETAARAARYAWLAAVRARLEASVVYLAHHADDQTETVLMRVLHGSGPAGLAGMAAISGCLVRPLLPFFRTELAEFVLGEGLPVWLDPANADPRHLRSWIRCELLPVLRTRVPEVDRRLRRLARQASRDRAAWDAAIECLPGLDLTVEPDAISVAGAGLQSYDSALAEAVVMALGRRAGCPIGPVRAARIVELIRASGSGAETPLGSGWRAELAFGRLRITRAGAGRVERPPSVLEGVSGERAWGRWRLRWRPEPAPEQQERAAFVAWFAPGRLAVRSWAPGDRIRPLGGTGRRLVVRCFQEARVPRRRRAGWPVLVRDDGTVTWVPGVCRSDALIPSGGTEAIRVDAEYA